MSNKIVIGTGACGFLRINHLLNSIGIFTIYKGGRTKYQNGFETWNPETGLIWDVSTMSKEERLLRAQYYLNYLQGRVDIAHYPLPYIKELIYLDPTIKILCLLGNKEFIINSLFTHWGYLNPLVDKRGCYRARYPLDQFSNYYGVGYMDASRKYVEEYFRAANEFAITFPRNFLAVNYKNIFEPETDGYQERTILSKFFNNTNFVTAPQYPVDYKSNIVSVTNHGGLGNNLFQMAFPIAFCAEYNLPKPIFGTWKLQNGGGIYPFHYNADRFLGGHTGTHEDMKNSFGNLDWQGELQPTYDTKFMINDMFCANKIAHMRKKINEALKPSDSMSSFINEKYGFLYNKSTISLHLRCCNLGADDHINGIIPFEFHKNALKSFESDNMNVLVCSDNNGFAASYINELKKTSRKNFVLIDENQFKSLFISAKADNGIMHISTLSFWMNHLKNNPDARVIYHKEFERCHTDKMISKTFGWEMME